VAVRGRELGFAAYQSPQAEKLRVRRIARSFGSEGLTMRLTLWPKLSDHLGMG